MMIANKSILNDFKVWINPKNLSLFNKREIISKFWLSSRTKADPPEIFFQEALSDGLDSSSSSLGKFALQIFFFQIFAKEEICIDLRPKQFIFKNRWHFIGESLVYKFSPRFLVALRKTYQCFYQQNAENLDTYLMTLGVISPDWSKSDKQYIVNLFSAHFNSADEKPQDFTLDKLIKSFTQIFSFLSTKNHVIHTDFAFLGIYLTSLYMVLEKSDEPIFVNKCFFKVMKIIDET